MASRRAGGVSACRRRGARRAGRRGCRRPRRCRPTSRRRRRAPGRGCPAAGWSRLRPRPSRSRCPEPAPVRCRRPHRRGRAGRRRLEPAPAQPRAGRARAAAEHAAEAALTHLVREPRHDDRREERQQLLHEAPGRAAQAAELVDDLVGVAAEDVADDGATVLLVDVAQAVDRALVVRQRREQRVGAGRVRGVGLESTEERRQRVLRRLADLVAADPELACQLVDRYLVEDLVVRTHRVPLLLVGGADAVPARQASHVPGAQQPGRAQAHGAVSGPDRRHWPRRRTGAGRAVGRRRRCCSS